MSELSYCSFPTSINSLKISSAYELQILALAATLPNGLMKSNQHLADMFHTHSRTVSRAIKRLKDNKYITNNGDKYHRILVANSDILSLFSRDNYVISNTELVPTNTNYVSTNTSPANHNKRNKSNNNITVEELFDFG